MPSLLTVRIPDSRTTALRNCRPVSRAAKDAGKCRKLAPPHAEDQRLIANNTQGYKEVEGGERSGIAEWKKGIERGCPAMDSMTGISWRNNLGSAGIGENAPELT